MGIFQSDYYSREFDSNRKTGKFAGYAAWIGVAALGLGAAHGNLEGFQGLLSKSLKGAVSSLTEHMGVGTVNRLAGAGSRVIPGSVDSVIDAVVGTESHGYLTGAQDLGERVVTSRLSQERTNMFLNPTGAESYARQVLQDPTDTQVKAFNQAVSARTKGALQSTDIDGARKVLSNSTFLNDIKRMSHEYGFAMKDMSLGQHNDIVETALKSAYDEKLRQNLRLNVVSDEANIDTILRALRQGHKEAGATDRIARKVLPLPKEFSEVRLRDVFDQDGNLTDLGHRVDEQFRRQFKLDRSDSFLTRVKQRFDQGLHELFGDDKGPIAERIPEFSRKAIKDYQEEFMNKGLNVFYSGRHDAVVSKTQLVHAVQGRIAGVLGELRLPLLPGRFDVDLGRMYSFIKSDRKMVRNLGRAAAQGELRRLGTLAQMSDDAELIGVGSSVMAVQGNRLSMLDGSFRMLPKRLSRHIEEVARIRTRGVQSVGEQTKEVFEQDGLWGKIHKALEGDPEARSNLQNLLLANQNKLFTPHISESGEIMMLPNQNLGFAGPQAMMVKKLFHSTAAYTGDVSPQNLLYLLNSTKDVSRREVSETMVSVADAFLEHASTVKRNLGSFLKSAAADLEGRGGDFDPDVMDLMRHADDPHQLWNVLQRRGFLTKEKLDSIKRYPDLFRAVQAAVEDHPGFISVGPGERGWVRDAAESFLGEQTPSRLMLDLQEALLNQVKQSYGEIALREAGLTHKTMSEMLHSTGLGKSRGAKMLLSTLGLEDFEQDSLAHSLLLRAFVKNPRTQMLEVDRAEFRKLAGLTDVSRFVRGLEGYDEVVGSKMIHSTFKDVQGIQVGFRPENIGAQGVTYARTSRQLIRMAQMEEVASAVRQRYSKGRFFEPLRPRHGVAVGSDYYLVSEGAPVFHDGKFDLNAARQNVWGALKGLTHPNMPHTPASYALTVLGQLPNELGASVGLGLSEQDRVTLLRSVTAFAVKRGLPLIIAWEAYKNLNAEAERMNIPGIDDMGANILANTNIGMARLKDALGLTTLSQWAVSNIPGLDQYFSPRSEQEYKEYLLYGNEAVRQGRGWVIGSRSPLMGGAVESMRPNFYRRWKSDWMSADNVDLANPEHSFLPTLTNPLAPITRFLDPDWWVRKHLKDRPYRENERKDKRYLRDHNYLFINTSGRYGGAFAIGSFGGGYPTSLSGGDRPLDQMGLGDQPSRLGAGPGFYGLATGRSGDGPGSLKTGLGAQYGGDEGAILRVRLEKPVRSDQLVRHNLYNRLAGFAERYREQTGLYGAFLKANPFWPEPEGGIAEQDKRQAIGYTRQFYLGQYGEALGQYSEFYRRLFGFPERAYDAFSPYRNDMPTWLPDKFHWGDPYVRVPGIGELQLPGQAFERANPWIRPLKARGSMIGMDEQEMIERFLDPTLGDESAALDYGTYAHKAVQRKLKDAGLLIGAEVSIYDPEDNISGTLDALVRGPNGPQVIEIKTQSSEKFHAGEVPSKYIDQLNYYLHTTQTDTGWLAFVNSDNPEEVRTVKVEYDAKRHEAMVARLNSARHQVLQMVEEGQISPYETYDPLARMAVLAKVAPNSTEFHDLMRKYSGSNGFNGQEELIFERIKKEAELMRQDYNLYAYRNDARMLTMPAYVYSVNPDGTITTDRGTFRMAGLDFDRQAFVYEDAPDILAKHGIVEGQSVRVTVPKSLDPDAMADTVTAGIFGSANRDLIKEGYGNPRKDSRDPMDLYALYGRGPVRGAIEQLVHTDNMLTNKFFRVRSALEQFERGEVFGTDRASWSEAFRTMVVPTFHSMLAKDPVTAGLQSGLIASLFVRSQEAKVKVFAVAGGIMAAAAGVREASDTARSIFNVSGDAAHVWTPKRFRERADLDEYWDTVEYVKQTAVAEAAKREAFIREGVNLDALQKSGSRVKAAIGPYSVLAVTAERKAKSTMFAFDVATGTLQEALEAIPARHRQIAEEVILYSSQHEKDRFYKLLPDHERRVLGKFLGVEQSALPERPTLPDYFSKRFLPGVEWMGWRPDQDLSEVESRSQAAEGTDINPPSRARQSMARNNTIDVTVPRYDHPTPGRIRRRLEQILATGGFNGVDLNVVIATAAETSVNVNAQVHVDSTSDVMREMHEDIRRG